jgi:hypothetical protein
MKKQRRHLKSRKDDLANQLKIANQDSFNRYVSTEKEDEQKEIEMFLNDPIRLCLPTPLTVATLSRANTLMDEQSKNASKSRLRKNKVGPVDYESRQSPQYIQTISGTLDNNRYFEYNAQ